MIGIEARGSAHYWAQELSALGHEVRLIPAAYVKPFFRHDARHATAVCTAVGRPNMQFVSAKNGAGGRKFQPLHQRISARAP